METRYWVEIVGANTPRSALIAVSVLLATDKNQRSLGIVLATVLLIALRVKAMAKLCRHLSIAKMKQPSQMLAAMQES